MTTEIPDKFHGLGGSYETDPVTGKLRLVERAGQDHPQGNAPRDASGNRIDLAPEAAAVKSPDPDPFSSDHQGG